MQYPNHQPTNELKQEIATCEQRAIYTYYINNKLTPAAFDTQRKARFHASEAVIPYGGPLYYEAPTVGLLRYYGKYSRGFLHT